MKGAYSIERGNSDSSNVITKVYAYGSTENLGSKYRYTRLCLPDKEKNKSFVIDDDKVSVYGVREAYKTFDDIKPERTGTITAIKDGDPTTFYDSTMFELTKTGEKGNTVYLINGIL